jgi:hypothetical protein
MKLDADEIETLNEVRSGKQPTRHGVIIKFLKNGILIRDTSTSPPTFELAPEAEQYMAKREADLDATLAMIGQQAYSPVPALVFITLLVIVALFLIATLGA